MAIDVILSGVTSGVATNTTKPWSLPYSNIVDQECIGHWEVCEIYVLPIV
jgi:hypothetical protein